MTEAETTFTRQSAPQITTLVLQQGSSTRANNAQMHFDAGPPWFFRADTNQDGDLSAAEFLGTNDVFQRLDKNEDGAIDIHEAVIADIAQTTTN